jgi:hypothetical protein
MTAQGVVSRIARAMRLRLVSPQLSFEEGKGSCARDFGSPEILTRGPTTVRLQSNGTEDVPGVTPGEMQLVFGRCLVRSLASSAAWHVHAFRLTTMVTAGDVAAGVAEVVVGFHAVARVEAVDTNGDPLLRDHLLGVALNGMTVEAKGPEGSPLVLLLPPGEYEAYLGDSPPVRATFAVREPEEDAGTLLLSAAR